MASKAELETKLRNEILDVISDALAAHFDLDKETQIEFVESGVLTIPVVDADADIYIRTIEEAPEELEYAVAKEKEPGENAEVFRVHLAE